MPPRLRSPRTLAATCLVIGLCFSSPSAAQDKGTATFGTTVVIPSGLRGRVYFLRPGESWLPDFSRLKPVGTIYTTKLDVPPQDWSLGFPGITNRFEWFAIDYTGRFWIETAGDYQFQLTSDDGSKLYIDEKVLINLDGTHPPQTEFARIKLDCGIHHIRVSYFQGPRIHVALVLSISGGGKKWRIFNTEEFKPPASPEDWKCGGSAVPFEPNRRTLTAALPFEAEAMEALNARPRPQAFAVRLSAFHFWQSVTGSQTSIAIAVPGAALSARRVLSPTKSNQVHLSVLGLVKAGDGSIIDKFSLDAPYNVPDADYSAFSGRDLVFSHALHLPSGHFTVDAVVIDHEARQASTASIALDTPPHRSVVGLSSVVLVTRIEPAGDHADVSDPLIFQGKRVLPHLEPTVPGDAKPLVYFVVYPDSSNPAKPSVRVQFLNAGQSLADQSAELPPPDGSGAIPMFVGAGVRSGDCELKITVLQGTDSATESVRYTVAAR